MARAQGFIDPIVLLARFRSFAQPSDVVAPTENLRAGAVLHARGLINSQAIQHNMDWIWPFWVHQQFDPGKESFIPRAFSLTHINLTHRDWVALGVPDFSEMPLVDPRGLVMPLFDSWSLDAWIIAHDGSELIPSKLTAVRQYLDMRESPTVITRGKHQNLHLTAKVETVMESGPLCRISLSGDADKSALLVIALRPYNPEGISFINEVSKAPNGQGWEVNGKHSVNFPAPDLYQFSTYHEGDVYHKIKSGAQENKKQVKCDVGMATAAAVYELKPYTARELNIKIPLAGQSDKKNNFVPATSGELWKKSLEGYCKLKLPDRDTRYLYDAAVRTLILHTPKEAYAGPYTYKRFWFRDAAFIVNALSCAGLPGRGKRVLDKSMSRQNRSGYFLSQDGEWDSNGLALWAMRRYCELTGEKPDSNWGRPIWRAGKWIQKKLISQGPEPHAGLLPSGFSAEHLGPSDYYYWDNFWGAGGLRSGAYLLSLMGEEKRAKELRECSKKLLLAVERSLENASRGTGTQAMPASPYRRLDSGSVGSLAAGYPLKLWGPRDPRLLRTADYLLENFLIGGGFYHNIAHSGINPYLTLHLAQVLLRAGNLNFMRLMEGVKSLASPAGQWPEAIHPRLRSGCMGDGQHVWAAAEWLLMVRNCFVREEESDDLLILCSGVPGRWLVPDSPISFGPAPTSFGTVNISLSLEKEQIRIGWKAEWHSKEPSIQIRLPGYPTVTPRPGSSYVNIPIKR